MRGTRGFLSLLALAALLVAGERANAGAEKIEPRLWSALVNGPQAKRQNFPVIVLMTEQADLHSANFFVSKTAKAMIVHQEAARVASRSQVEIQNYLQSMGVVFRSFYASNAIAIETASGELIQALADRRDVKLIKFDGKFKVNFTPPNRHRFDGAIEAIGANIDSTGATQVWQKFAAKGGGIVVAGQDTGVQWEHPALRAHYRGVNKDGSVDHTMSWHDAIHRPIAVAEPPSEQNGDQPSEPPTKPTDPPSDPAKNKCGYELQAPCDDDAHGTHTMGTMIGDDGGENKIGMAPEAKWIACRNMDGGVGRPSTYLECFEYFLAPYPQGADPLQAGNPAMAPHVINNSWGCPADEECRGEEFLPVLKALKQAGVMVVVSAGNDGPTCASIKDQPATHSDVTFSVGAHNHRDGRIASFSSRGPSAFDGKVGPDLTAPGVSVRSSIPGGGYDGLGWSGTSMAGPHVVGAVALLWSAKPELIGKIDETIALLESTATAAVTEESCGGVSGTTVPNNTYGFGRLNVLAAVEKALSEQ